MTKGVKFDETGEIINDDTDVGKLKHPSGKWSREINYYLV